MRASALEILLGVLQGYAHDFSKGIASPKSAYRELESPPTWRVLTFEAARATSINYLESIGWL